MITGDTQKYRIFEGLAPTMQPSEAGMVTNPMPGTFKWWYFRENSMIIQQSKLHYYKALDGQQWAASALSHIAITTPNGTHLFGEAKVDASQFKTARNTMNVTMGDTWARGDLNTAKMHFATTQNGVGADLVFDSAAHPQDLVAVVCGFSTHL